MSALNLKAIAVAAACTAAIAAVPITASAQLSTTANGPYYATPSWDQKLTSNRFVVLANWDSNAVLDRETGLVWTRNVNSNAILADAFDNCAWSATGGRRGWRLPTLNEMQTIVDPAAATGFLPTGHPFLGLPTLFGVTVMFYTATRTHKTVFAGGGYHLVGYIRFPGGYVLARGEISIENTNALEHYFCVRGGLYEGAQ